MEKINYPPLPKPHETIGEKYKKMSDWEKYEFAVHSLKEYFKKKSENNPETDSNLLLDEYQKIIDKAEEFDNQKQKTEFIEEMIYSLKDKDNFEETLKDLEDNDDDKDTKLAEEIRNRLNKKKYTEPKKEIVFLKNELKNDTKDGEINELREKYKPVDDILNELQNFKDKIENQFWDFNVFNKNWDNEMLLKKEKLENEIENLIKFFDISDEEKELLKDKVQDEIKKIEDTLNNTWNNGDKDYEYIKKLRIENNNTYKTIIDPKLFKKVDENEKILNFIEKIRNTQEFKDVEKKIKDQKIDIEKLKKSETPEDKELLESLKPYLLLKKYEEKYFEQKGEILEDIEEIKKNFESQKKDIPDPIKKLDENQKKIDSTYENEKSKVVMEVINDTISKKTEAYVKFINETKIDVEEQIDLLDKFRSEIEEELEEKLEKFKYDISPEKKEELIKDAGFILMNNMIEQIESHTLDKNKYKNVLKKFKAKTFLKTYSFLNNKMGLSADEIKNKRKWILNATGYTLGSIGALAGIGILSIGMGLKKGWETAKEVFTKDIKQINPW